TSRTGERISGLVGGSASPTAASSMEAASRLTNRDTSHATTKVGRAATRIGVQFTSPANRKLRMARVREQRSATAASGPNRSVSRQKDGQRPGCFEVREDDHDDHRNRYCEEHPHNAPDCAPDRKA